MKKDNIFSISILELILVVFFMYIVLTVYQLSFKDTHIGELEKTVQSQREITQEVIKKEYPKLENRVADLINLEKYKKLYEDQMNKNSGMIYIENSIIGNLNDAKRLKDYNKYEKLIEVKNEINEQILELKGNKLTIDTLNELNIKNEPLHRQIQFLEKKVKDNYQNKLNLANKLKDLKTNETVKYILLKLNKYDAPVQEQLAAIDQELKKLNSANLSKNYTLQRNYNKDTEYILKNLNQTNKPVDNQIKVLKQVLENKKLIQKIKMLENRLANSQKGGQYSIDTNNIQRALKNLQELKKNINGKYEVDTKDIIRKLNQENKPLDEQIANLKKQLELENKIKGLENQKRQLEQQLQRRDQKLENALKNLQDIKSNTSGKYDSGTNEILKELNQTNEPLQDQISELKKQQELINKGKELENRLKGLENQIDNKQKIQKALKNLQDIKDGKSGKYEPDTNEILKELNQTSKPLEDQISELKKQIDSAKNTNDLEDQISELKKQLENNNELKNPKIKNENIQKALDNLQDIKNDIDTGLDPATKEIIKELNQSNKPLGEQINELKKQLDSDKKDGDLKKQISELQKQIENSNKLKNPNIKNENIQKALDNLQDIKKDKELTIDPATKEIIKELNQSNKPLDEQINELKKQLELGNDRDNIKEQIGELKKQIKDDNVANNPSITDDKIQKALENLQEIKDDREIEYDPNTKEVIEKLDKIDQPLDEQIKELERQQALDKKAKDLDNQIKQLEKQLENFERDPSIKTNDLKNALENIQNIKDGIDNKYDSNTKKILEKLQNGNKPISEQIKELQKEIDAGERGDRLKVRQRELQKQLADNEKLKDSNINSEDIQKALENLQDIKDGKTTKYNPITNKILDRLEQNDKPLNEQINKLKDNLDVENKGKDLEDKLKELEKQIAQNEKLRTPNTNVEDMKKALENLQDIKDGVDKGYKEDTKDIIEKLKQTDKPLNEQINELRKQLSKDQKAKEIEDKIKDIQKQLANNNDSRDTTISDEDLQKALDNLRNIKDEINKISPKEREYKEKLKDALDGLKEIKRINEELADKEGYKPRINKDIEQTIKYLEDKEEQPDLKPSENVKSVLDRFKIEGKPTDKQLSDLYQYLYSRPVDNTNISELNFVINRLNDQNELENKIERINEVLKEIDRPRNSFIEDYVNNPGGKNTTDEIRTLNNQIKYLRKKIEKSGKLHMPCFLDDEGSTLYLFKLFLREDNIYVQMGWQEGVAQMAKGLPNLDKLVEKTLSLDEFMRLTKPIFEQSVKDECRQFVYFEDETVSKREYKRKTLTIEHHFYKYIEPTW